MDDIPTRLTRARAANPDAFRLPVECGGCGWKGRRAPGTPVKCPKCGAFAAFQAPEATADG